MKTKFRLAIVVSHPIQYYYRLYQELARRPEIELMVYYCDEGGTKKPVYDPTFKTEIKWDIPLLEGYPYRFLRNFSPNSFWPFCGFINPSVIPALIVNRYGRGTGGIDGNGNNFVRHPLGRLAQCTLECFFQALDIVQGVLPEPVLGGITKCLLLPSFVMRHARSGLRPCFRIDNQGPDRVGSIIKSNNIFFHKIVFRFYFFFFCP